MSIRERKLNSRSLAPDGIDYFNRGHWLTAIQERVSLKARQRMFELWRTWRIHHRLPSETVLDIGATPDTQRSDSNCFLTWFHDEGLEIHCYSPEPIDGLLKVYPFIRIVRVEEGATKVPLWPVASRSFDWSASSAVLEHVGSREHQVAFVAEHARAAKAFFLTTPNLSHWLEFHTKLPLLHWLPRRFHGKVLQLLGKSFWADQRNLRLVTKGELLDIAREALGPDGGKFHFSVQTIWTLGMPSNLVLLGHCL